jgi:hypothetical protein
VSNSGQFRKGNKAGAKSHGGGRPRNEERDALRAIIDANVSPDAVSAAFRRIESILLTGGPGWLAFFREYMDRRYGKPDTYQELDVTSGGQPLKGYTLVSPDDWPDE